ncbi:AAA family ATPase [Effusibacillus lacus]|uniref:AAA domain-containing protein n=1 Tax=Effusibacillus lacus TaxID=1348429 RepID=A0A292YGA3_9BACL|nr:AAA family ATPase [Effusibacillus lacus]TCS73632.1 AAA domain-containing protein [Effusibacillus lacus]GAX89477.1 hypothetical protein [Effusibacillus lacus]
MARIRIRPMLERNEEPSSRGLEWGNPGASLFHRRTFSMQLPSIQVFFSAKGGSGTTLLACTYASALRLLANVRVLLVDMDLKYGGVEAYMGIRSDRSIFHLKPVLSELTEVHIRNITQFDPVSQVEILPSPADADLAQAIEPQEVVALLMHARKFYDVIVVDAGSEMSPVLAALCHQANHIHYVLTPDTPSLRRYAQSVSLFEKHGIPLDKVGTVLNRISQVSEIQPKDLKGIRALRLEGTVRADFHAIQPQVNLSTPLIGQIKDKKAPVYLRDVVRLVQELAGQVDSSAGQSGLPL